jgi:DNA polymerase III delta prime subunit
MNNKKHTLWVELYRSKIVDDYVGNEKIKSIIQTAIEKNDIQNMILYGTPGTGKTTLAKLIVNSLNCDYLYLNASDEKGMDVMRDKVKGFASSASFKPLKIVILDEADFIRVDSQALLRNIIETFSLNTRFILTCNYIDRIIDPLQSRCKVLEIVPPSKVEVAKHVSKVLDTEQVQYKLEDLATIVNKFYPDIRKILNTCQFSLNNNILSIDSSSLVSNIYIDKVIDELKKPNSSSLKNIRQIIADSNTENYDELYKMLYGKIDEFSLGNEGEIIILLEEYLYHSSFRLDKEINVVACLARILQLITKKKVL